MITTFFGGEFFGGEFFSTEVAPPAVVAVATAGGRPHRRRIPRYIRVDEEEEMQPEPLPAVPFAPRPIAVMLPRLTSFEAGITADYIEMNNPSTIRVKNAPPEWDEDEEWLLMH